MVDLRPRRVLVVDDEELLLRSLTRLLTRAGFDVVPHLTVAEAAAALREDPEIAVVLTDLKLGRASGMDLIPVAASSQRRPAVIVFSGAAAMEDVDAVLAAGARAVIRKPVQPSELIATIAAVLAED
jgi:DNA-binding response OmpR family regulator